MSVGAVAVFLGLGLHPPPDIEICGLLGAGDIARRQLRNLHEAGLDGVQKAEVGHNPRERLSDLVARALDIERRSRKIDAKMDAAPPAAARQLVDAVKAFDPDRRFAFVLFGKVFVFVERFLRVWRIAATVGVMCFIVENQPVRTAAFAAAELMADALEPGGIGLEILGLDGFVVLAGVLDDLHGSPVLTTLAESPLTLLVSFFAGGASWRSSPRRAAIPPCGEAERVDGCDKAENRPSAGSSSCSRSRMVTFGQTIRIVSENRSSRGDAMRLRMDHAASIPMTVVLPEPVAILQAYRIKARTPAALARGRARPWGFPEALAVNFGGFDQEDDRFDCFDLRKEKPLHPVFAAPELEQFLGIADAPS